MLKKRFTDDIVRRIEDALDERKRDRRAAADARPDGTERRRQPDRRGKGRAGSPAAD